MFINKNLKKCNNYKIYTKNKHLKKGMFEKSEIVMRLMKILSTLKENISQTETNDGIVPDFPDELSESYNVHAYVSNANDDLARRTVHAIRYVIGSPEELRRMCNRTEKDSDEELKKNVLLIYTEEETIITEFKKHITTAKMLSVHVSIFPKLNGRIEEFCREVMKLQNLSIRRMDYRTVVNLLSNYGKYLTRLRQGVKRVWDKYELAKTTKRQMEDDTFRLQTNEDFRSHVSHMDVLECTRLIGKSNTVISHLYCDYKQYDDKLMEFYNDQELNERMFLLEKRRRYLDRQSCEIIGILHLNIGNGKKHRFPSVDELRSEKKKFGDLDDL